MKEIRSRCRHNDTALRLRPQHAYRIIGAAIFAVDTVAGFPIHASMRGDFLFSLFHFLVGVDAVGGDFDFGNATEGEQKLYEILGRLFRSLFHDVGNSVGDGGLEHDALGLQAGQVHTHELAGLQHDSKILPLRAVKCKPFPMILDRRPRCDRGRRFRPGRNPATAKPPTKAKPNL